MLKRESVLCDLCVIGGGMAGLSAAISAAREGLNVVLMHERPVLGGNASSEIRMWICGARGEDNRETGIMEEIALENLYRNPTKNFYVWDGVLYDFVMREKNITLLLNCTCMDAKTETGAFPHGRDRKILSVTGYQLTTQKFYDVEAKFFLDASGDSILQPLTGAEFRIGREGADEFGECTSTKQNDMMTMGMSCLIQGRETDKPISYVAPEFSKPLDRTHFENRNPVLENDSENFWYLELGGDRDTIGDTEKLRHELMGLAAGTWDYIKNSGEFHADNWELEFFGFLPGKRESRRMLGEYMLTQTDISAGRTFDDEVAFGGWPLDDHFPGGFYHRGVPNTNYLTPAPYSLPYRCLYSKNVDNLFFAGRNVSCTHMAMSSTRVMATCALFGEAAGKAAAIAVREGCAPNDVYRTHIRKLQKLLLDEDCFLPSRTREIPIACLKAEFTAGDELRNGKDRPHRLYGDQDGRNIYRASLAEKITYSFQRTHVKAVHIVFDSDLNRVTLPGSECERTHLTRASVRLDSPVMTMPKTLVRSFRLLAGKDGAFKELVHVDNNRKRAYHIPVNEEFDSLILIPYSTWGDADKANIISFDFE